MTCNTKTQMKHQPYPTTGRLANRLNLTLPELSHAIQQEEAVVYSYVVATTRNVDGRFVQTGCAPNFQGEVISLCTCKHFMRSFLSPKDWKGKWVAGFSGVTAGNGHNILVYLMRVGHAFESHQDMWMSTEIPHTAKLAKLTHVSDFGDVYQPTTPSGNPFSVHSYLHPGENHVHTQDNEWHRDINYEGRSNRKAALLVGDADTSFLWEKPMLSYRGRLHRGQKKIALQTLLDTQLTETRA